MTSVISLDHVDKMRLSVGSQTDRQLKSALGQFMTPSGIARFMAGLFPDSELNHCKLLDAGAGMGALSCAFLDRWKASGFAFDNVDITAFEIDPKLKVHLKDHLGGYTKVVANVVEGDFIELTASPEHEVPGYTHAILNPPYKKINSNSVHRRALRSAGIETVNLYSAFVALAVAQMASGGQLVAIIPRSFCNGPYYKPFREFILERAAIRHIHLFKSRSTAFKDDAVLQENIIIRLEIGAKSDEVVITTSSDDTFNDLEKHIQPFERIVFPDDHECFIHVPTSLGESNLELSSEVKSSPEDIGFRISTGPVVGFRLKSHLRSLSEPGTVPLLYPNHFSADGFGIIWPGDNRKKPSALHRNAETERWLYPNGFYCLVRRFSSKEERRRIVARVLSPSDIGHAEKVGLENYFNVFHYKKEGIDRELAYGLAVFLNSTIIDEQFRRFNGHTQVNATDLKLMKYPRRNVLIDLGTWALSQSILNQVDIDQKVEGIL